MNNWTSVSGRQGGYSVPFRRVAILNWTGVGHFSECRPALVQPNPKLNPNPSECQSVSGQDIVQHWVELGLQWAPYFTKYYKNIIFCAARLCINCTIHHREASRRSKSSFQHWSSHLLLSTPVHRTRATKIQAHTCSGMTLVYLLQYVSRAVGSATHLNSPHTVCSLTSTFSNRCNFLIVSTGGIWCLEHLAATG